MYAHLHHHMRDFIFYKKIREKSHSLFWRVRKSKEPNTAIHLLFISLFLYRRWACCISEKPTDKSPPFYGQQRKPRLQVVPFSSEKIPNAKLCALFVQVLVRPTFRSRTVRLLKEQGDRARMPFHSKWPRTRTAQTAPERYQVQSAFELKKDGDHARSLVGSESTSSAAEQERRGDRARLLPRSESGRSASVLSVLKKDGDRASMLLVSTWFVFVARRSSQRVFQRGGRSFLRQGKLLIFQSSQMPKRQNQSHFNSRFLPFRGRVEIWGDPGICKFQFWFSSNFV